MLAFGRKRTFKNRFSQRFVDVISIGYGKRGEDHANGHSLA